MKKSRIFVLIIFSLAIVSCSRIVDQILYKDPSDYTSPYKGKWIGNYYGDETGTFNFEIGKDGSIKGLRNDTDQFDGRVYTSGDLQDVKSPFTGFSWYGSLETKKGTWLKSNSGGNWIITKL